MNQAQVCYERAKEATSRGRPRQAAALLRRAIGHDPEHAEALYLYASLLSDEGNTHDAATFLQRAVAACPDYVDAWIALADARFAGEDYAGAVCAYERAVELRPREPMLRNNLAVAMQATGRFDAAAACCREALALQPDYADAYYNLGMALQLAGGDDDTARESFTRAVELAPDNVDALNRLGMALQRHHDYAGALKVFGNVLQLTPRDSQALFNVGAALQSQGLCAEALTYYDRALAVEADDLQDEAGAESAQREQATACNRENLDIWVNKGVALHAIGRTDEAVECYRCVLAVDENHVMALNNLGNILILRGEPYEAEKLLARAIALASGATDARNNMANALQAQGRISEALAAYEKLITEDPVYAQCRFNYSLALLLAGDYERGWSEHEWRLELPDYLSHRPAEPRWDGTPVPDKTLLVTTEQGFGDNIQFLRYIRFARPRVGRLILECRPELAVLARNLPGIDAIVENDLIGPPAATGYDFHVSLLSLPYLFLTTLETLPAEVPYLFVEPSLVTAWRERLAETDCLRVGLIWSGNPQFPGDRTRSCSLQDLAPLATVPGVRFYSLQKGPRGGEAANPPTGMDLIDLSAHLTDFAQTAAAMQAMDLVISTCTSPLHLAGALGTPVWAAIQKVADWRWMLDRDDSPWYPTMRLFRQTAAQDWLGVYARIADALRSFDRFPA